MTALPALLVLAAAVPLLGHAALAAAGTAPPRRTLLPLRHRLPALLDRLALDVAAGLVVLFVLLLAMDLAAVPWRRGPLLLAALAAGGGLAVAAWRRRGRVGHWDDAGAVALSWGDGGAALVLASFATAVWTRRIAIPDFVYHWGLKGKRYWLEGGIDFAFLADPLGLTDHPDYPNLLPSLYAVTAEALGGFRERAMLAWSALFLLLVVLCARRALEVGTAGRRTRGVAVQAGTLAVAMVASAFAVGYDLAGGGDLLVALAVVAALPGLLGGREDGGHDGRQVSAGDLRVGLAAALAAGAKIEGVPLAAFLVAVRWWKVGGVPRWGTLRRQTVSLLRRAPRLALPLLLVAGPWVAQCLRHGLFQSANTGSFDIARWSEIQPAAQQVMNLPEWHRLPWLLLLLPLLLLVRRLRPAALLLHLQAAFYLFVYLTAPVDTDFYVLSSLPRLLFHLVVPAVVLLVVGVTTVRNERPSDTEPRPA